MEGIIEKLKLRNKTIATMESCTGGALANAITNIEGASDVFRFGAVTYSNEYKVKMGVPQDIIDKYTVYSPEAAIAMAKAIAKYANTNYGIGITGKLKRADSNNPIGENNIVYVAIYSEDADKINLVTITVDKDTREENKKEAINIVINKMNNILK